MKPIRVADSPIVREIDVSGNGTINLSELHAYLSEQGILGDKNMLPPLKAKVTGAFIKRLTGPQSFQADPYPGGHQAYVKRMQRLCKKYPKQAELLKLGEIQSRISLHALRVTSDIGKNSQKPNFIFTGLLHGREWATGLAVLETAKRMLTTSGDRRMAKRLRNAEAWFVPVANPVGYNVSRMVFPQWRKNWHVIKLPDPNLLDHNVTVGVDLNRNFGSSNTFVYGGSGDLKRKVKHLLEAPRSDTYRGPHPGSEKEVQLLQKLITSSKPIGLMDIHSHGNYFICPSHVKTEPSEERQYRAILEPLCQITQFDPGLRTVEAPGHLIGCGNNGVVRLIAEIGAKDQPDNKELERLLKIIPRMNIAFMDLVLDLGRKGKPYK